MTKRYQIAQGKQFRKDLKVVQKRGYNLSLLGVVVDCLAEGKTLSPKYKDHPLSGEYAGCRECHITSDWLLIYRIYDNKLILYLTRTGSHSDVF